MRAVVDTNVVLVANESHADVAPECVLNCVELLTTLRKRGRIVVDDDYRILTEYQNKTFPIKGKKVGDAFVKWILQNVANPKHVETVAITESEPGVFEEIPAALQGKVDPADRKFVATALSHPRKPLIAQAVDSKWMNWHSELADEGVRVEFVCPDDIRRHYRRKFPLREVPEIE